MKLTDSIVRKFRIAKIFKENSEKINSIDFSVDGTQVISSSDDDSIVIYDCQKGVPKKTLYSKKYGVDLIRYTHSQNCVIYSSNKIDDTLRYLSLQDNKFIRYFPGHTKKVVALSMSPVDDTFLSGSLDKTIRLWDLRSTNCQGMMIMAGRPVAAFDPEGLIFAAGINSEMIKLYDLRSYDKVHGCETRSGYKAWRRQCAESNELCTENCLCHVHCDNKAEQKLWHDSSRSVDENCLHRLPFLLHKKTEVCLIGPCYHTHSEKYFKQTTGLMLQPSFYMDQTCTCRSECMRHSDAICLQKMEGAVRGTGKKASVSINCQYHQQSDSCHCQWHRLTHQSAALVNRTCALLYTLFGLSCQNSLPLVPS